MDQRSELLPAEESLERMEVSWVKWMEVNKYLGK